MRNSRVPDISHSLAPSSVKYFLLENTEDTFDAIDLSPLPISSYLLLSPFPHYFPLLARERFAS